MVLNTGRRMLSWIRLLPASCFLLPACSSASEHALFRGGDAPQLLSDEEVFALGLVDENWDGAHLGLDIGEWTALGPVTWRSAANIQPDWEAAVESAAMVPDEAPVDGGLSGGFFVIDVPNGQMYHVQMDPAHMDILGGAVAAHEAALEASQEGAAAGEQSPTALPGGLLGAPPMHAPTRSVLADDDYAEFPWNTMGPGNSCTGTMIGATTLVTAGHCVVKYEAGDYREVYAGTGDWAISINSKGTNTFPRRCYNDMDVDLMFVPEELVDPGHSDEWYYGYDYALIALEASPSLTTGALGSCPAPSEWMQRESLGDNDLFELSLQHDGYPSCTGSGAPNPCGANWHFETLPCAADTHPGAVVVEDGLDATVLTDAVVSPGHSGGPFWYINENGKARLVGTQIGGDNSGEMTGLFRRFTPTSLSQISAWICVATSCI